MRRAKLALENITAEYLKDPDTWGSNSQIWLVVWVDCKPSILRPSIWLFQDILLNDFYNQWYMCMLYIICVCFSIHPPLAASLYRVNVHFKWVFIYLFFLCLVPDALGRPIEEADFSDAQIKLFKWMEIKPWSRAWVLMRCLWEKASSLSCVHKWMMIRPFMKNNIKKKKKTVSERLYLHFTVKPF